MWQRLSNFMRLIILLSTMTFLTQSCENQPAQPTANIVILFADDLGYGDIGCYGNKVVPTPYIDSIANNGVRCSDAYVTAAVCAPSRAGLLTGRYQQRFGFEFNMYGPHLGLPDTETTLAEFLKKKGYVTGIVGKWHLGVDHKFHPMERGFDEYFGFRCGTAVYAEPAQPGIITVPLRKGKKIAPSLRRKSVPIERNKQAVDEKEYLTDALAREAVAFIERHQKNPFFLYVPFNAVHTPFQATKKYYDRFATIENEKLRIYAAMTSALDDAVGAILKKLRQVGLEKNTLVFFLSDNGAFTRLGVGNNGPLRGDKTTYFEGGIRVPFLVQWPGYIPAGKVYRQPVSTLDILPTVLTAIGTEVPKNCDGVDLLPHLTGKKETSPHEILFWRAGPSFAVRQGHWKIVKVEDRTACLYDLSTDLSEKNDVAKENPEVVQGMLKALSEWEKQLKPPMWPARPKINFSCPTCQTKYSVTIDRVGEEDDCRKCGARIVVPES